MRMALVVISELVVSLVHVSSCHFGDVLLVHNLLKLLCVYVVRCSLFIGGCSFQSPKGTSSSFKLA